MNLLLLGSTGLIGSRIKRYLRDIENINITILSLRESNILTDFCNGDFDKYLFDIDIVINTAGPNVYDSSLNHKLAETFYFFIPKELISYCTDNKIKYIQFSSIHSVSYKFSGVEPMSPFSVFPTSPYAKFHNHLERLFLEQNSLNNYATVIRLSNTIGPSLSSEYYPNHWLSLANKFSFDLFKGGQVLLKDPKITRSFLPISILLINLRELLTTSRLKPLYQYVSNFSITLEKLLYLLQKYHSDNNQLNKRKVTESFIINDAYTDLGKIDIDDYVNSFMFELENIFTSLNKIL